MNGYVSNYIEKEKYFHWVHSSHIANRKTTITKHIPKFLIHGAKNTCLIWADWLCMVAGRSQEDTSRILRITFLKSGCFRDQNVILFVSVMSNTTYLAL